VAVAEPVHQRRRAVEALSGGTSAVGEFGLCVTMATLGTAATRHDCGGLEAELGCGAPRSTAAGTRGLDMDKGGADLGRAIPRLT
jgi:hypothetical protein